MKWGAADPGMDYLIQVGRQRVGAGEAEHIPEGRRKGQGKGGADLTREVKINTG